MKANREGYWYERLWAALSEMLDAGVPANVSLLAKLTGHNTSQVWHVLRLHDVPLLAGRKFRPADYEAVAREIMARHPDARPRPKRRRAAGVEGAR